MSELMEQSFDQPDLMERIRHWNARQELLSSKKRLALYRRLERFAARGYDTKVPLEDMLDRAREKKRDSALLLEQWLRGINGGSRFSALLGSSIPPSERMAIASGEDTGRMEEGFAMAAYIVASRSSLRSAVLGSLAYPVVLMVVFSALLFFVAVVLMPTLANLFPIEQWPLISKALYYVSAGVRSYGLYVLAFVLVGAVTITRCLPSWVSTTRDRLDRRLPPWSVYREVQGGMLLVTLSSIVQSGSPIDEAFRKLKREASPWMTQHLEDMMRSIAEGRRPAQAMNTGLFSEDLMDDLMSYDRAGDISECITTLGREAIEHVIARIKSIASIASGLLMVAVGLGLVWSWGSFILVFMAMRSASTF